MGNVIDFKEIKKRISCKTNIRFSQRELAVKINEVDFNYLFIVLEDKETLEIEDTIFSKFYFTKKMINNSINTQKQDYGRVIVQFLNFIFFHMEDKLDNIEDLTVEQGTKFLSEYSVGIIGGKGIKREETMNKAEYALTRLYYWLCYGADLKMKYIKRTIFKTKETKHFNPNTERWETRTTLESIFIIRHRDTKPRNKLKTLSEYIVIQLILIAYQYDPMMALAIALQAFAGLREGEVCQMTFGRIIEYEPEESILTCDLDLQVDLMLRDDGTRTGDIKTNRIQPIYEAFMPYFDRIFKTHKLFLEQYGFDKNKYGAMFLTRDGIAMNTDRYNERFNSLIPKLQDRLQKLADLGSEPAKENSNLLQNAKFTSHSLRYFFTQYVAEREGHNPFILASYRGDSNINTALRYLRKARTNVKHIHEVQDSFAKVYEDVTGQRL